MITPKQREDDETMEVSPADFRKVLGRFATGVTVVTTCDGEHRLGITVNAFSSVSLDPPLILVCIEKTSYLHQVMLRNGYFAVNVQAAGYTVISEQFSKSLVPKLHLGTHLLAQLLLREACWDGVVSSTGDSGNRSCPDNGIPKWSLGTRGVHGVIASS